MEEHHHGEEEPALIIRHMQPSQNNLKSRTRRKTWWDGVQCAETRSLPPLLCRDVCLVLSVLLRPRCRLSIIPRQSRSKKPRLECAVTGNMVLKGSRKIDDALKVTCKMKRRFELPSPSLGVHVTHRGFLIGEKNHRISKLRGIGLTHNPIS